MPSSLQRAATHHRQLSILHPNSGVAIQHTDVLGRQHGSVGRRLVTIGLDLHATGDTRDGFATRQIGDVDEGIVEGGEDAGNAEDQLALLNMLIAAFLSRCLRFDLPRGPGVQAVTLLAFIIQLRGNSARIPGCSPGERARPSSWEACWLRCMFDVRVG